MSFEFMERNPFRSASFIGKINQFARGNGCRRAIPFPTVALFLLCGALPSPAQEAPAGQGVSREIWIGLRTDHQVGTGTLADPFNGSGDGFDAKMRELSVVRRITNIVVHLLPGEYPTKGGPVWYPLSGWKVRGAGIDVTTVKLTGVSNDTYGVIAQPTDDPQINTEVTDLTADCNYGPANPNFASGVVLQGTKHAIRRVKAIHAYGRFPDRETFIIGIGAGLGGSDGNVIEDCEVSQFKGNYCTAISFGGPLALPYSNTEFISGIIRGNRVLDLHTTKGPSTGIAYGGGGMKNVIIENNFCNNCTIAVNLDSARDYNVTFKGNHFLACRARGIGVLGQVLDNFIIEDNVIEMDPASREYGIVFADSGGANKVTNFKIRNNVLRTINGRANSGGGIGFFLNNADSISLTGNRIEAGLRSAFLGPGAFFFDNTDFTGKPIRTVEGYGGNQVNVPRGEKGMILLNKGSAYVIADVGANPETNGANLNAAYLAAKQMRPHGQPLGPDNRATVFLWPGRYALPDSALVLDAPYVDLAGLGNAKATILESDGNTLVQAADDVNLENLSLHCRSIAAPTFGPNDKAAYFPVGVFTRTTMRNCNLSASNNGFSMRLGIAYGGCFENTSSGPRSWGGPGSFSGVAVNCAAGDSSFASFGVFAGFATNCSAGVSSFGGGGGFHGWAKNCTAGNNSFGGSGIMVGCEVAGAISSATATTGKLTGCHVGPAPGNVPAIVLGPGATLYNCTLIANPASSAFSIDAAIPVRAKITHCRLNHGLRNVINDIAQPYNVDDPNID